jgi:hypothetical protein
MKRFAQYVNGTWQGKISKVKATVLLLLFQKSCLIYYALASFLSTTVIKHNKYAA